jgi:hypothetical protein
MADTVGITICNGKWLPDALGFKRDEPVAILHGNVSGDEIVTFAVKDPDTGLWSQRWVQVEGQEPVPAVGLMDDPLEIARRFVEGDL